MKPMRITLALATGVGIAVVAYLAGRHSAQPPSYETNTPRILYYRDPMHPSYHADKPGTAPDCGMRLEPVYAGNEGLVSSQAAGLINTFHISPERQRLIRPKVMTVTAISVGLLPVLWSTGIGADTMKRIAAPMVGGVFSSFLMELLVYPAIYEIWKWNFELRPRLDRNRAPAIAKIYDAGEEAIIPVEN